MLIIMDFNYSLSDEIKFFKMTFVALNNCVCLLESAEKINDNFISESSLAFIKEMLEVLFKFIEYLGFFDKSCLHFWSELLVEWELLNDKIEIM